MILLATQIFAMSTTTSLRHEVVVFGSTAIDFVAYSTALPQKGETIFGSSFAKNFGGKGANQVIILLTSI